ncbi:hypothetical protein RMATCC62417_13372 [Rhizopus microsporus]|nr:hypothetical protein RMATCC62417_13372 [Rhizopus microsporus]
MQWRPLILLFSGIATIYLISLLQDMPHPHPKILYTPKHPFSTIQRKAEKSILTTVDDYAYITLVIPETSKFAVGTEKLKLGVKGSIRQFRKPLSVLVTNMTGDQNWSPSLRHDLPGQISSVTERGQDFLILYHVVQDDFVSHYARLYYPSNDTGQYEYKDIMLPGSTWINSVTLHEDSILFSRDPDQYHFHLIALPPNIKQAPHSIEIVLRSSELGKTLDYAYPEALEQYPSLLSRLYSAQKDTYRVMSINTIKNEAKFQQTISIIDNTTLSERVGWKVWANRTEEHPIYYDESVDDIGFAHITYKDRANNKSPKICFALSSDTKTIVLSTVDNKFFSYDYTDRIDIIQNMPIERDRLYKLENGTFIPEYYYRQGYDMEKDIEIAGIKLNQDATMMAIWTKEKNIYIYKRQVEYITNNSNKTGIEEWIDLLFPNEDERYIYREYLPPPWEITMEITLPTEKDIKDVKFYDRYFFVVLDQGRIFSYIMDDIEEQEPVNFITFIKSKWDMLIGKYYINIDCSIN